MESETLPEAQAEKTKPAPQVKQHHEEHKEEEAEWQLKGSDSTSSWHRVMKVTKKTSSKTEQCTKTYKIIGGKKILVDSSGAAAATEHQNADPLNQDGSKSGDQVQTEDSEAKEIEKEAETHEVTDKPDKKGKCECCHCCAQGCTLL